MKDNLLNTVMNFKVACTHYVCVIILLSIRSKYVMTMYRHVNAMCGICTKQVDHRLMADLFDLLQICNRSVTDMLHTSNSSVAV